MGAVEGASVKPRLGFVVAALNTGGAERHTVGLRRSLSARGYESFLLAIARAKSRALFDAPGSEGVIELGAKRLLINPLAWVRTALALRRLKADVIVATNPAAALVVSAARSMGLIRPRVICVFHTTVLQPSERASFGPFRWAARQLDALVYVSETQKRFWEGEGLRARRALAITNGVDLRHFDPALWDRAAQRAELGLSPTDYVIGIVAGLRPEKRHGDLLQAVARLRERGMPAKALIVGNGETREALEALAGALDIGSHVLFAGDQQDVRPFIVACDVGVLCSTIETFSLAALEVLALGVPMVASDVGAMGEIIHSGVTGLLYEMGSVDQLADQLARLYDPQVRGPMAAAARTSARAFDIDRMVDRYDALIEDLVAAR